MQARVLDLFQELQERYGFACLFISHDLAVIEKVSSRSRSCTTANWWRSGKPPTSSPARSTPTPRGFLRRVPCPILMSSVNVRELRDAIIEREHLVS